MGNNVYDLIKEERKKRGLPGIYWSRKMAQIARSQANYCAKAGRMIHTNPQILQAAGGGGECLAQGWDTFPPRSVVDCWLLSEGHREIILDTEIRKAGVGIAKKNGKSFVAFTASYSNPCYPDCPYYKPPSPKIKKPIFKMPKIRLLRGGYMLRRPIRLLLGLCGLWGIILGAHGLYGYFGGTGVWFSENSSRELFMVFGIPGKLGDTVSWMSNISLHSWFIPAVVFIGGWIVVSKSGLWDEITEILSKLKLW